VSIGDAEVRAALAALMPAEEIPETLAWQFLAGGVNRRSVRVAVAGGQWVVRLPHGGAASLLDLATEARVTAAAALAGVAPPLVGADPQTGVLATEYFSGARPWDPPAARRTANVERIAKLLVRLHAVAVDVPPYSATSVAEGYLTALATDRAGAGRGAIEPRWAAELVGLAERYDAAYPPSVLCHNDLVAANVLDAGDLKLVDFEYAVLGAPILDLAGLAAMNDYTAAQCERLLNTYYRNCAAPFAPDELRGVVRMLRLIAFFWARVGERRAGGAAYSRFAERMSELLER
jgi:thiamine kinase-like enzyme